MASWNKYSHRHKWIFLTVMLFSLLPVPGPVFGQVFGNEETEFRETIFNIHLNGQLVASNVLVLEHKDGQYSVPLAELRVWRLVLPPGASFIYLGVEYVPLRAFPGLLYELDVATLVLTINAPGELFELTERRHFIARQTAPQDGTGAYLNYNFQFTAGQNQETIFNSVFEAVLFAGQKYGTLVNNFAFRASPGDTEVIRLTNTWTKDLVGKRQSIRLGDSITRPTALSPGFEFGGIQWSTNFSLEPTFITAPLRTIGGLTEQPSVVEIFVNDVLRNREEVPAGPFLFDIPGYGTGETDLRVVVTDVMGRQQLIHQSLYANPDLLAKGLSDFSVQAGLRRENFGLESFDYGQAFFSGTFRHGLTNSFTGEGFFGIEKNLQVAGALVDVAFEGLGRISGAFLGSHSTAGTGFQSAINFEYINSKFNFGLRSAYASAGFRQLGFDPTALPAKWINNARIGTRLGDFGGVSFAVVHQVNRSSDDITLLLVTQSINLKFGSLAIDASVSLENEREFAAAIRLIVPFGRRNSVSSSFNRSSDRYGGDIEFRRSLGASDVGVGYRVRAEKSNQNQTFDGGAIWQNEVSTIEVEAARRDENVSGRVGMSGAIGFLGGKVFVSRRINNEFAVVDVSGIEGITVYLENRNVGKTDSKGRVHVPGLGAYRENQIRLETTEVPFEATLGADELSVVPYFRSGILVKFPVELTRSATVTVNDADGIPLDAGSPVFGDDGVKKGDVGFDGFTFLTGLGVGEESFTVRTGDEECSFLLDLPEILQSVPDLGAVECR